MGLALFYGLPNKSLEEGLKLIHTDKDVHTFFVDAKMNGKIHLYIGHKQQDLGRYYLRNMVWVEEDAGLRCSSSTPLSTRIKRKRAQKSMEVLRKKVNLRMVDDEPVGRKSIPTSRKGKEIMYELTGFTYQGKSCSKKYGLINLYIAHIPKNLAEYYYKNLTFHVSNEEVKSKLKTHEKRKLDACSMSPYDLVECAEQEAGSPYLRTPPLKPRRKGIEFPCKNLFGEFLHCDSVVDEVVLHDNWKYEGLVLDGYIDVGGSSTCCDLVHENVVDNGDSLPNMDKECFSNNVVLDAVVPNKKVYTLPLLLKKKCRNKVNVTRKTRCLNNSKTLRLRKGLEKRVSCGANN
ncbi:hypothetical protein Tco_1111668 [Tanacetum coccineum]|uniref:Uncharacterized protein n=1 Tax=Tanacetum coccineum TaxID=301880 RepID=A0ABQ5INR8_9ASTR